MSNDIHHNSNTPNLFDYADACCERDIGKVEHPPPPKDVEAQLTPQTAPDGAPNLLSQHNETFVSVKTVAQRYGVSPPTIWRWLKTNPKFPKPYKPSPGVTRWKLSEILAFEAGLQTDEQEVSTQHLGRGK